MSASIFEPIFVATKLTDAVTATLKKWFPTYLAEVKRQMVLVEALPVPRSWNTRPEGERFTEDQLPAVVVVSPGLTGPPAMEGDGTYRGTWRIGIAVFNSARDEVSVDRNSKVYAAVVRAILLQKRSLGGVADNCDWIGENYDVGPTEQTRTFGVCTNDFDFLVVDVVNKEGGPVSPDPPDPDTLPGSVWPIMKQAFVSDNGYIGIGARHEP